MTPQLLGVLAGKKKEVDIYAPWTVSSLPANVTATASDYRVNRSSAGVNGTRVVYQPVTKTTGKWALRFLVLAGNAAIGGPGVGLLSGAVGSYLGFSADCATLWANIATNTNDRTIRNNVETSLGNLQSFTADTELMIEVDLDSGKIWFGLAGTFVSGGDPAAGTGQQYTLTTGIAYQPACDLYYANGQVRLLRPSEFTTPASSGFTAGWPT